MGWKKAFLSYSSWPGKTRIERNGRKRPTTNCWTRVWPSRRRITSGSRIERDTRSRPGKPDPFIFLLPIRTDICYQERLRLLFERHPKHHSRRESRYAVRGGDARNFQEVRKSGLHSRLSTREHSWFQAAQTAGAREEAIHVSKGRRQGSIPSGQSRISESATGSQTQETRRRWPNSPESLVQPESANSRAPDPGGCRRKAGGAAGR